MTTNPNTNPRNAIDHIRIAKDALDAASPTYAIANALIAIAELQLAATLNNTIADTIALVTATLTGQPTTNQ